MCDSDTNQTPKIILKKVQMCIGLIMSILLFGAFLSSSPAWMEKEKYKVAHNGKSGTGEISKGGSGNLNRQEGVKTIKTFVLS